MNTIEPIIYPPKDGNLRKQLETKLKEYEDRRAGKKKPWETMHPDLAYQIYESYRETLYKIHVLTAVLEATAENPVDTGELSKKLFQQYGDAFDTSSFTNACGVVTNYLGQTSYELESPGTGLPALDTV